MVPVLECRRLTKRFGGVTALEQVDFDLLPGEIHALVGENGAGKSTLIKVLGGIHPHGSYEGELRMEGQPASLRSVADAKRARIAVIYQELALVDEMTVAENIYLGKAPTRGGLIDWRGVFAGARRVLSEFAIEIDPAARVGDLGVGQRQLIEIAKALAADSRILILDEPTAALTETETEALLRIVRDLRARGVSLLYISHRLSEVFAIADRITVLRDGRTISTRPVNETNSAELIRDMVGREITTLYPRHEAHRGERLLKVRDLTVARPEDDRVDLSEIDLDIYAGEVLGIGGLMGSGRTKLLAHLFGAWGRRIRGSVELSGAEPPRRPREALLAGLVLVSEDRQRFGLVVDQTIGFNLSLSSLDRCAPRGFVNRSLEFDRSQNMARSMAVKAPNLETAVRNLSGGNQQKVVLGKALLTTPRIVLLDEPTRGIDIGAKAEIYALINRLVAEGAAVVLVSSELPELVAMSDRIIILREGTIGGEFTRDAATPEGLMAAATGETPRI